ncbi:AMP-binding protein [Amycolatopsis sp. EV170708-02-1]|uniref:AMP-binding protein n=1 Tax=Amycolatopsis sp. EV170708-02-1 TaxID=2919322 RepID=UPI001F0C653E|nr:AMP-binding protein [Amycolatopsis sp. EV170708-02-1]UMP03892.1 AMP-binding protein [Amycolatopsis sp. EV170708-02-1]
MTKAAGLGFLGDLAIHGDRTALIAPDGSALSYRELDRRVSTVADRLGPVRRLVLLAAANDVDTLVAYLAALRGGHPVLLVPRGQADTLTESYDPDVVIDGGLTERRPGTAHELHPELALLLSTSGSTGSPKLVRLSAESLRANAAAIAEYLDIRAGDRAVAALPLSYCYGLSVVNSNLLRGACLLLTERSVLDPAFWTLVKERRATSLHGVPHTFALLDRAGFDRLELPDLRYVTQAGGRLDPAKVAEYAELGRRRGWRFFVMYGQTEATARMAYLPPELAGAHPTAIGLPVPGGEFDLADDGELIYRGPNVMLGYAHTPADLALGRTVHELPTGDLGRRNPAGLYEVTGRKSRFVKPFGLRVDLDRVERLLAEAGIEAVAAGDDTRVVIAVHRSAERAAALVRARFGLPPSSVFVHRMPEFPLLPNGKPDYRAIAAAGEPANAEPGSVRQAFAAVFGRRDIPGDATFVGLGGDSLSYVRMSIALERVLGRLPDDWPSTPVSDLEHLRATPSRWATLETNVLLRALAIVFIVGTHMELFTVHGGAHLLLIVAGWNFARFVLPGPATRIARAALPIAVPAIAWLGYRLAVTDDVSWTNVLLINNFTLTGAYGYWFVEVLVHAFLALSLVFAIPAVRRAEREHGFATALVALGAGLLLRVSLGEAPSFPELHWTTLGTVWFFALGWLAHKARTGTQRAVVLAFGFLLVPGMVGDPLWEAVVLGGLVLVLLQIRVPVPGVAVGPLGLLASASLYVYLTHWTVFPALLPYLPAPVVLALSLAAGTAVWWIVQLVTHRVRRYSMTRIGEPAWKAAMSSTASR